MSSPSLVMSSCDSWSARPRAAPASVCSVCSRSESRPSSAACRRSCCRPASSCACWPCSWSERLCSCCCSAASSAARRSPAASCSVSWEPSSCSRQRLSSSCCCRPSSWQRRSAVARCWEANSRLAETRDSRQTTALMVTITGSTAASRHNEPPRDWQILATGAA